MLQKDFDSLGIILVMLKSTSRERTGYELLDNGCNTTPISSDEPSRFIPRQRSEALGIETAGRAVRISLVSSAI